MPEYNCIVDKPTGRIVQWGVPNTEEYHNLQNPNFVLHLDVGHIPDNTPPTLCTVDKITGKCRKMNGPERFVRGVLMHTRNDALCNDALQLKGQVRYLSELPRLAPQGKLMLVDDDKHPPTLYVGSQSRWWKVVLEAMN